MSLFTNFIYELKSINKIDISMFLPFIKLILCSNHRNDSEYE